MQLNCEKKNEIINQFTNRQSARHEILTRYDFNKIYIFENDLRANFFY